MAEQALANGWPASEVSGNFAKATHRPAAVPAPDLAQDPRTEISRAVREAFANPFRRR